MPRLHLLVGAYEIHVLPLDLMMTNKRMGVDVGFDLGLGFGLGRFLNFLTIFDAALDKNREGGGADHCALAWQLQGAPLVSATIDSGRVERVLAGHAARGGSLARMLLEDAGVDDPLAVETCVYDVAATGNEDFVDSSATLQEAVEELGDAAPEPVFATEEPDLVPDDDGSSFPWLLVGAIVVVAGMEGALASVVGGLTGAPVVAVPTSKRVVTGATGQATLGTTGGAIAAARGDAAQAGCGSGLAPAGERGDFRE